METLVRDWHGAGDGRIRIDYNIHSEYLSTETVCRDILDIVRGTDLRLHIHLSETEKEVRECRERHGGLTPVAYFDSLGLFEVPVTAAHCVWWMTLIWISCSGTGCSSPTTRLPT